MDKPCWTDMIEQEQKEEDIMVFTEDDVVPPSEAKLEFVLSSKLTMDAIDMGALPNADYNAWATSRLRKTASECSLEERRSSNLSLRGLHRDDSPSPRVARIPSLQRLRTSASMDRLDEMGLLSPRGGELNRRSSNLSQVISTLKKSPSMDFSVNKSDTPPPPLAMVEGGSLLHQLGPRRQSNLAVMRLIAESM